MICNNKSEFKGNNVEKVAEGIVVIFMVHASCDVE